jgi:heat shock protein HtpX
MNGKWNTVLWGAVIAALIIGAAALSAVLVRPNVTQAAQAGGGTVVRQITVVGNGDAHGTPDQASITVTTGLFELMTDRELEGVLGHELGHIRNYDIRVSLIVFGLVVAVGILADLFLRFAFFGGRRGGNGQAQLLFLIFGLVAALVTPLLAGAVQAAISRQREYLADATSAMTTRDPDALASALGKLGEFGAPLARANTSMAHLWIADPLRPSGLTRLFATHPPIADRIERLTTMGGRF